MYLRIYLCSKIFHNKKICYISHTKMFSVIILQSDPCFRLYNIEYLNRSIILGVFV